MVNKGVIPVPSKGGIENHTYYLANSIASLGNEVTYITNVLKGAKFHEKVVVKEINLPSFPQPRFYGWNLMYLIGTLLAFRRVVSTLSDKYDILHIHDGLMVRFCLPIRKKYKQVFTLHAPSPWKFSYSGNQWLIKFGYKHLYIGGGKKSDHVIAVNSEIKEDLKNIWQVPDEKITFIPNGVDTNFFRPDEGDLEKIKRKYGISTPYCLFVGRLIIEKGVEYLLEALKGTNLVCVIVGSGPRKYHLISLAKKLGIYRRIVFTDFVPLGDLVKLYAGAKFFVLPSIMEGLPLAVLEAMASGLPVVVSDLPGLRDIVTEAYDGFFVPPANAEKLRERIEFLAENTSVCKKMGKNARETAKKYSWAEIAKKTVKVYERVAN